MEGEINLARLLLGLNCNCFTNRYTEPKEWTRVCAEELGVYTVQYSVDLLDPYYPWELQKKICDQTLNECLKRGIRIKSNFGGHFSHQHYLGHPDAEVRREAENWFRRMIDQTAYLGGEGTGTCFAIMTVNDNDNAHRREYILKEATEAYYRLAEYAGEKGQKYIMFETTSVPRESCSTISETRRILEGCKGMAVPMMLCLDVGHRDMGSADPRDGDPVAWIEEFRSISPVIHLQQTDNTASCHWPFTPDKNKTGIVDAEKVVNAAKKSELEEVLLAFEIGVKAFYPSEYRFLDVLKASVEYWRPFVRN